MFIDLCNSFNENGMPLISFCPSTSFLQMSHSVFISYDSPYSIQDIPFMGRPFVRNVVDYFKVMSFITHADSKLRYLNYDKFHIENVCCILTTFNGDVLFEFPPC